MNWFLFLVVIAYIATCVLSQNNAIVSFEDLNLERIPVEGCAGTPHYSFATVDSGCDGNSRTTLFHSDCKLPVIITFDLGSPKIVEGLAIGAAVYDDFPREWTLSGSKDNKTFTKIQSYAHDHAPTENRQNFCYVGYGVQCRSGPFRNYTFFDKSDEYQYYKITITKSTPGRQNRECIQWSEVDFYAKKDTTVTTTTATLTSTTTVTGTTHTQFQDNDRELKFLDLGLTQLTNKFDALESNVKRIDNSITSALTDIKDNSDRLEKLEAAVMSMSQVLRKVASLLPRDGVVVSDGGPCSNCAPSIETDGQDVTVNALGGTLNINTAVCGQVDPCKNKFTAETLSFALQELKNL